MRWIHPGLYHPKIGADDIALDLVIVTDIFVRNICTSWDRFSFQLGLQDVDRGLIVGQGSLWVVIRELGKVEIRGWGWWRGCIRVRGNKGAEHLP